MLIRAIVRSSPDAVFQADKPCTVYCWVCSKRSDGTENSPVSLVLNLEPGGVWKGCLLPLDMPIPIQMGVGDCLFASTTNQAELSLSVVEMSL